MPNFNPFNNDQEDTSFEQGSPVTQAAKNITKAAQQQTDDAIKKSNDEIVAELYGPSTPAATDQGTDEANTQMTDHTSAGAHMAKTQSGNSASTNPNQTPEEQATMAKIRRELESNYSSKFQSAPNGAQNITTNLEMEMEKARQERKRREEERKREQEEEEQRKKEEEAAQQQTLAMPAGKKIGFQMGKKQQQPIELERAKTRTEINRGTTG